MDLLGTIFSIFIIIASSMVILIIFIIIAIIIIISIIFHILKSMFKNPKRRPNKISKTNKKQNIQPQTKSIPSKNTHTKTNTKPYKKDDKFIFPREEYKKYHQEKNEENKKIEAFKKGEEFENYVENNLFPEKYFILLSKTHNYETNNKRYVEDSLKPDLKFRDKKTGKIFYVECKFRSNLYQNKFHWTKSDKQFDRYKDIELNENIETFIAMGLGGTANNPNKVYLMPLREIKYTALYPSVLKNWEITNIYNIFKIVN
jgi:ABC-type multidrug transport system fused ATPase/permease subunit